MNMSRVVVVEGKDPDEMIPKGLDNFAKPRQKKIVIKPNLIVNRPPPTTTPKETVGAIVRYYHPKYEQVIAEGSGWCDTWGAFRDLSYLEIAEKFKLELVDLNEDKFEIRKNPDALTLLQFKFPLTLKNSYLISVAVLKEHSATMVTLSLKNMLGATLGEKIAVAKKRRFHRKLNESIVDINLYKKPDLSVIDGRKACLGGELGGTAEEYGLMIFSDDPVAADAVGAKILGHDPLAIKHLRLAQEKGLGAADLRKIEVVKVK